MVYTFDNFRLDTEAFEIRREGERLAVEPQVLELLILLVTNHDRIVSREQVLAIGDGINDVDFLAWAGLGVAMGDGHPEALAAADVVAPTFEQEGVAWAIEALLGV